MSKQFRPWKIDEIQLLPPSVQDFVPKKHLARFILGLVRESLDLKEIKSSYPSTLGQRPSFRAIARSRLFGSVSDTTRYASPMSGWLHGLFEPT